METNTNTWYRSVTEMFPHTSVKWHATPFRPFGCHLQHVPGKTMPLLQLWATRTPPRVREKGCFRIINWAFKWSVPLASCPHLVSARGQGNQEAAISAEWDLGLAVITHKSWLRYFYSSWNQCSTLQINFLLKYFVDITYHCNSAHHTVKQNR